MRDFDRYWARSENLEIILFCCFEGIRSKIENLTNEEGKFGTFLQDQAPRTPTRREINTCYTHKSVFICNSQSSGQSVCPGSIPWVSETFHGHPEKAPQLILFVDDHFQVDSDLKNRANFLIEKAGFLSLKPESRHKKKYRLL